MEKQIRTCGRVIICHIGQERQKAKNKSGIRLKKYTFIVENINRYEKMNKGTEKIGCKKKERKVKQEAYIKLSRSEIGNRMVSSLRMDQKKREGKGKVRRGGRRKENILFLFTKI